MTKLKEFFTNIRALKISLSSKFIIGIAIVLSLTMGFSIYFISAKHADLVYEQLNVQAKALFTQIVLTRQWIADHGGIYVGGSLQEPNPYLQESEITDTAGKRYIRESPAMVTKELSKYAREKGTFWFNITSLKLFNPNNAPDEFEHEALLAFESSDQKEISKMEKIGNYYFYRYIAPLYIKESCLQCHDHQGYTIGDVRGAISITMPVDHAVHMINSERRSLLVASAATIGLLMFVLFIMMKTLVLTPVRQLNIHMKDFSAGRKSNTSIIRTGDELEDLSRSFMEMSKSLTEYHSDLENKVSIATKSFEEANTRLALLNEKKSDFIASISHELRTPMTSIKGAMDYIRAKIRKVTDIKETEELMEFLDVIKNNADRLIRMVNDTLDLERFESGMYDLHLSDVDMVALVKEVIVSFQSISVEKGIVFEINAPTEAVISADEDRIRQVLINLISNAIQYSPRGACVTIHVDETIDMLNISIMDEGPGIPAEVREKIFDKFYTIGNRYGTGLGLAICKSIVDAHKGRISASKNSNMKGSTFYMDLPIKQESAQGK
jgi:signal transduction histidine kinase